MNLRKRDAVASKRIEKMERSEPLAFTFETSSEQELHLARIMVGMQECGLDSDFIVRSARLARRDQGVYELMELLFEEEEESERGELIADLEEILDEELELARHPERKKSIPYRQLGDAALGDLASQISEHKARLRRFVDGYGGVSEVARKAGMHQSALSRLLHSGGLPRRTTLYRIADALDLPRADVLMEPEV